MKTMKTALIIILFAVIFLVNNNLVFGQEEISAAGYVIQNDYGKMTIIFGNNETEEKMFYNGLKDLFDDGDLYIFTQDDLTEHKEKLIEIFLEIHEQFFYDIEYYPETFTVIADVEESQITEYRVTFLTIHLYNVVTEFGTIDHLNFIFINTTSEDEVLFCNIEEIR